LWVIMETQKAQDDRGTLGASDWLGEENIRRGRLLSSFVLSDCGGMVERGCEK
jgi:hypothetical protein